MAAGRKKRADGRFTVTLTHNGRRLFFYGRTQAEARAKADAARERIKTGGPVRDASRTLADWLEEWQQTFLEASGRARSTKTMHAGYCRAWIVPTLGDVRLDKLNPGDVNRLVLEMKQAGKADATRRNCYTTLRKALDDAVLNGLLAANPVAKVSQPRPHRKEARFLTPDEINAFLAGASSAPTASSTTSSARPACGVAGCPRRRQQPLRAGLAVVSSASRATSAQTRSWLRRSSVCSAASFFS